jgi:hypothetical protein
MMECPLCGEDTKVLESRESPVFGFKRRRECVNGHKFSTKEIVITEHEMRRERIKQMNKNFKRSLP